MELNYTIMIRAFTIFCKLNLIKLSAEQLFLQSMQKFSFQDLRCPHCGAKHPQWDYYASYERCLISFEHNESVCYVITITRLICPSCNHTHAILPDILIPHGSYSLLFILNLLRDYFTGSLTVQELCDRYQISVSTLYAWKRLFYIHKKLWLGVLDDSMTSALDFLSEILSPNDSIRLDVFFLSNAFSFLQGVSKTAHSGST